MITIDGKSYPTTSDAAEQFHVSSRTVLVWIRDGTIPPPPEVIQGKRTFLTFPPEYMSIALQKLEDLRKLAVSKRKNQNKK
jgi:predicted site-specific integrase-resolvase